MPAVDDYLARISLDRKAVQTPDHDALHRLQRAHVTSVPFETLSITGAPDDDAATPEEAVHREGVVLELPHLYDKIVTRERGGFCFELNGAFGWLLDELGFDADRVAGRVADTPPANHHSFLVHLDRTYVVDVGLGGTRVRRPIPIDGSVIEDEAGYAWRVREHDRPDLDYRVEAQGPDEDGFEERYSFDATPRSLSYFEATCDYLQSAPESGFTGDPIVSIATSSGRTKLTADALIRFDRGDRTEESVGSDEWHDVLERKFGLRVA